jgi:eukaryotic translation initiation factor 2C
MLDELKDMLIQRLVLYEKKNKCLPDRIFVYRDGVSEVSLGLFLITTPLTIKQGQFDTVLKEELPQALEAFKALSTKTRGSYRPSLSIIICGFVPLYIKFPYDSDTFRIQKTASRKVGVDVVKSPSTHISSL